MKIQLKTIYHFSTVLVLGSLCAATSALAQINKCKDDSGRIVYSDAPCRPPPPPKQLPLATPSPAAKPASPAATPQATTPEPSTTVNSAVNGKLTEKLVSAIVKYASDLAMQSDYRGQCALAANDLKFQLTDHSSRPATVATGGRREICELQRESAVAIRSAQLQPVIHLDKQSIALNSSGTQAIVSYDAVITLSMQGQVVIRQRCNRKETLAVYQNQVLYSEAISTCRPQ